MDALRLLCVLAHPDDESIAVGGVLATYAAEGVETYLVTATRGERGWLGDPAVNPGPRRLGEIREAELGSAAAVLGLREVTFLDYVDGELDRADVFEITRKLARQIRRIRPHVVVTFGPDGLYGHPDHIAISQLTTAAIVAAADAGDARLRGETAQAVSKLYHLVVRPETLADYEGAFGAMAIHVDGHERRGQGCPNWSVSASVDATAHWERVWAAIRCHRSQLPHEDAMASLPPEHHRRLWGTQNFYRVFSLVNGGRAVESDLFEGLREQARHLDHAA